MAGTSRKRLSVLLGMGVAVCALGGAAPLRSAEARKSRLEQVVVVFKTHFDIGYTALAREVLERYRTTMIDKALEVVDASRDLPAERQFCWTIPGWPMAKITWPDQSPDRLERIHRAFRRGRFVTHALPFTTHTETLEPEDLVRGLWFASTVSRQAGLELPRDAKMTDVPSHSWILPTLLTHAGVDFLHLGCNAACSSPAVPLLFWWQGPDGSRLLTMYSASGYGTALKPPPDWPHRTWLALVHTGDNHGPPRPEEVRRLFEEAATELPGVELRIGRLSDFADAIRAEGTELPVVRGDMPDTWIHGPMSDPAGAGIARRTRPAIAALESLNTLLGLWRVDVEDARDAVSAAYELSLLYGEHTWGGSLWWAGGTLKYGAEWRKAREKGQYRRSEESWEEHTRYIEKARRLTERALLRNLEALARSVAVPGRRVTVYNPLPWPRRGWVSLAAGDGAVAARRARSATGTDVSALVRNERNVCFYARDIPSVGYKTYVLEDGPVARGKIEVDEEAGVLESERFRVVLDPARGAIRSWVDKSSGRELVDASASQPFGGYLYERFDRRQTTAFVDSYLKNRYDWALRELAKPDLPPPEEHPYRAATPRGFSLRIDKRSGRVTAILEAEASGGVPHPLRTKITLHEEAPYLDLELELIEKPADPWPEAGWICFPFRIERPRFHLGRLGGVMDPARDIVEGSNHHMFCLDSGLAVTAPGGRGVGLCSPDTPMVSLGQPGAWRYSRQRIPRRPTVYVHLFNNQWSTNFRFWNGGTWSVRVRLWPIDSFDVATGLIRPAWEVRSPLLAGSWRGPPGSLPPQQAGLEVGRAGTLLSAFGPNPDGEGLVLRLWEAAGTRGSCRVVLPEGLRGARLEPCDLRGRVSGPSVSVDGGVFETLLRPNAPSSWIVRP